MEEFNFYILKMQNLTKSDKIHKLLGKRQSRVLVENITLSVEQKKEKVDKIKSLIKEKKNQGKENVSKNLASATYNSYKAEMIMENDVTSQEENFKKRLLERRVQRSKTQARLKIKDTNKQDEEKKEDQKKSSLKRVSIAIASLNEADIKNAKSQNKPNANKVKTPPRRKSNMGDIVLGEAALPGQLTLKMAKFKKPNLGIDLDAEKISEPRNTGLYVDEENINEIFDKEYDEKIEENLKKVWDNAEKKMTEDMERIEQEMEKLLDELGEEKFRRTMETNNKYDLELKDLEEAADLSIF